MTANLHLPWFGQQTNLSVLKFCYLRFHSHVISVASPFNVLCLSQRSIGQSTRK